jgi:hypothetical protein
LLGHALFERLVAVADRALEREAQPDDERHGLRALGGGAARGLALASVLLDLPWLPGSRLPTAQTLLDVGAQLLQLQQLLN